MVLLLLVSLMGLTGSQGLSAEDALSQVKSVLKACDVPGPYRFRSTYLNGKGQGRICVVKLLDGDGMLCTGESVPAEHEISLVYRGTNPTPTVSSVAAKTVPLSVSIPFRSSAIESKINRWANIVRGKEDVKLTDLRVDSQGIATATYSVLRNGLTCLNCSFGFTIVFSKSDGRFLRFTSNLKAPPVSTQPIRLSSERAATEQFKKVFATQVLPEEIRIANGFLGAQFMVPQSKHQSKVVPKQLSPSSYSVLTGSKLGYFATAADHQVRWVWEINYKVPKIEAGGTIDPGKRSVLIDACTGTMVTLPVQTGPFESASTKVKG